ncbi:toprim domain-containing protein [Emticicia sp. SJ17W-69]|uniref:toprim domain-containing protein n=1 Tax=Emticicia sp. SJ17W-69 TaxID=3421657 RepID=UPI003EB7A0DB
MNKEEILGITQGGFAVFKHFLPITFKVGKNFLNPFYNDTKASCNIYFDKNAKIYKIKDFGDNRFNGDCFSFVAAIKDLNTTNKEDFREVLKIIEQELQLSDSPMKFKQLAKTNEIIDTPSNSIENITFKEFSETELVFWKQFGIKRITLEAFKVVSIQHFQAKNKNGNYYTIENHETEPVFGYKNKHFIKVYRPNSELRFLFLGEKSDNYVFGLDHLPPRGDVLFITGGEKDVLSLFAHGFFSICFNSENAAIPPDVIRKLSYRFRHIVLLYDVDKAGLNAVTHHQQKLKDFDIKVMLLPLSGKKNEKDISDFFRLGHTADELKIQFNHLLENLYAQTFAMLKSCEIDFKRPPKIPKPLVTIAGVTIGSQGNLLGITGSEGSGKSNFLGGMIAGALAQTGQKVDSLGTQVLPNLSGKALLYFDTEQSEDQLYRNLNYILQRCELDTPPEWFKAYCLINLSRRERMHVIMQSVDKFHHQFNGVHAVVIDGIGDLISSLNDERESVNLIEELHRMAGIYQTCIACVLHLVPSGVKLRGHLGSELQRKSAGILCIEKDENTDISCIKALKVRSGSPLDVPLIQFAWDKEKGYHVHIGEKPKEHKQQRKIDDLTNVATELFKDKEKITYSQLMNFLAEMMGVTDRMAKNYIRFMQDHSIIEHTSIGKDFQLCKS